MASNTNNVTIEGNMVRDPELRTTNGGQSICSFSIASNRFFKKGDEFDKEVSYFDVQCWAGLAQDVNSRGKKGSSVKITGRLKQERWVNKEGKNCQRIIIVAESVQVIQKQNNYYHEGQVRSCNEYASYCPF
jgi:single-strand DNA-binding protein